MKPHIQFLKRDDGVRLAYSVFGEGFPFVVAPPWVSNLTLSFDDPYFMNFWKEISKFCRIVLYDKHGCGQSDRDRKVFDAESELYDLRTVIECLQLDNIVLFGNSMASTTAISYAADNQQKISHLILYGAYANGSKLAREDVRNAVTSLVRASWGMGSKALTDLFIPKTSPEIANQFSRYQRESASPEVAAGLIALNYKIDVTNLLDSIRIPTLVLHRNKDLAINVAHGKEIAYSIPNARLKILGGRIHFPYYEEAAVIVDEIRNFLGVEENTKFADKSKKDQQDDAEQLTIAFTDIVSSTNLITKHGDAESRDIFKKHDEIIRQQVANYKGRELQNLGDGFMLAFKSASLCIKCCCSIRSKIAEKLPMLDLKIGINTGEILIREGKHPFGQAVVLASRIVDKCQGNQILISDLTKQLVAGSKFTFSSCSEFTPKGFKERLLVHEVKCDI
jgi:class 3 adenylate cyclase/pimeloyl-ACP methyl ester carboxylesterase